MKSCSFKKNFAYKMEYCIFYFNFLPYDQFINLNIKKNTEKAL